MFVAKLSCFQEISVYAVINIFSSLPTGVAVFMNDKAKFKVAFRKYPNTHCFLLYE
jgi:hypothetical protein